MHGKSVDINDLPYMNTSEGRILLGAVWPSVTSEKETERNKAEEKSAGEFLERRGKIA